MNTLLPPLPGFGMRGMGGSYCDYPVTVTSVDFDPVTGLPDEIGIASPKKHHMELRGEQVTGFAFDLADPFTLHGFRLWLGFVFGMDDRLAVYESHFFEVPDLGEVERWHGKQPNLTPWCQTPFGQPPQTQARYNALLHFGAMLRSLVGEYSSIDLPRKPVVMFADLFAYHPDRLKRAIYLASAERP